MTKAKIVLLAVAVFGVISGTLAFKATKFNGQPFWTTTLVTTIAGVSYSTDVAFCTRTALYPTNDVNLPIVTPFTSVAISPASTITLFNSTGGSTTIAAVSCVTTIPTRTSPNL